MQEHRKHPIHRIINNERPRNVRIKVTDIQFKQDRQVRIIKTPNINKKQILYIESSISQTELKKKEKIQLLPKVTTSAHKRSNQEGLSNRKRNYPNLYITSNSWCLYDSNIKKYLGFRQDYRRQIASLTKIMTTFLAIKLIQQYRVPLECVVKVTKTASEAGGTTAQLRQNVWITIEDLLYGTMLPSGNDAAYSLAEYFGYLGQLSARNRRSTVEVLQTRRLDLTTINTTTFVQQFISQMNDKASKLGLYDTRFSNPHGLQNALNASSAKDIIKLSLQATKNGLFAKIMNTYYYKYRLFDGQKGKYLELRKWWNTNKLLLKGWSGVKTGQTGAAGGCLCSLKDGIFIIVLNSESAETRFSDTQKIFNWYKQQSAGQRKDLRQSSLQVMCESNPKIQEKALPTMHTEISL